MNNHDAYFTHSCVAAGYAVGFFGKYLNLSPRQAPTGAHTYFVNPGPDARSSKDSSGEYYPSYWYRITPTVNETWENTDLMYETDIITKFTNEWFDEILQEDPDRPFMAYIAPHAPHGFATPQPQYNRTFRNVSLMKTPSYNYSGLDHHWLVRQQPPLLAEEERKLELHYQKRWECLLSVDDMLDALFAKLEAVGQLDNTIFFYTSGRQLA